MKAGHRDPGSGRDSWLTAQWTWTVRQSGALQWVRADREDSEIAGVICAISAAGLIAWAKHIIPPPAFAKAPQKKPAEH